MKRLPLLLLLFFVLLLALCESTRAQERGALLQPDDAAPAASPSPEETTSRARAEDESREAFSDSLVTRAAHLAIVEFSSQLRVYAPLASDPVACASAYKGLAYFSTVGNVVKTCNGTSWLTVATTSTAAPIDATYITQTANSSLTNEQATGALASALLVNTTTTGVLSAYAGTSCTNQFIRSMNVLGAATCAPVSLTADVSGDLPFANLTQASGASKLLGRGSASGAGDFEEIGLGTGLSMSGTTLSSTVAAGGSNTQVQYNNSGAFGGISGATTDGTTLTLVAPVLGTPVSGTLTNATGLPISTGVSGLGTGVATFLATPSSANLKSAVTDETGSGGALVFATSPTLTTPNIGAATATSINGNTFTTGTYTLAGVAGKTFTFNKTLTFDGTDSTTMTFPTTSATIARTDAANTFTGHQTIEGVTSTGATGTGKFVFDTTPTFTTSIQIASSSNTLSLNSGNLMVISGGLAHTIFNGGTGDLNIGQYCFGMAAGAVNGAAVDTKMCRQGVGIVRFTNIADAITGFRINGAAASGNYLRGDGTNFVSNTIQAGDLPTALTPTTLTIGGGTSILKHLSATATLDFANLAAIGCEDLTITVTGAALGDTVAIGVPNGSVVSNGTFFGWVSASNTVSIKFCTVVSGDPASGTFRADVWQH